MDRTITYTAVGLGLIQMYMSLNEYDSAIIVGLLASTLWIIHQYRNAGLDIWTVYMLVGFLVQLYIMRARQKRKRRVVGHIP